MEKKLLKATHQGTLKIGEKEFTCAVLEDGTRIISKATIFRAFGRTKRGRKVDEVRVLNMPSFIDANNLQPFIDEDLRGELIPLEYTPITGKVIQTGYNALILPKICDVYLSARLEGRILTKSQLPLAAISEILVRGFSKIGIIALIDEATGYQEVRDRLALQKILDKYLREDFAKWAKTFPDEFYKGLFRLKEWQYNPLSVKKPGVVAYWTKDLIYKRLAPGVLTELQKRNPPVKPGRRKHKLFGLLTDDYGIPALKQLLTNVIFLFDASPNWNYFYRALQRAAPKYGDTIPLGFPEKEDEVEK
jgi:P63C domain